VRRLAIGVAQLRVEARAAPFRAHVAVVDLLVEDALAVRALHHRHRQPARFARVALRRALVHAKARAVLVARGVAALELHVIEQHEEIRVRHALQVAEPGEEMRLVDGDDHRARGTVRPPA
jgi:hypothetical protein